MEPVESKDAAGRRIRVHAFEVQANEFPRLRAGQVVLADFNV
ncbi:MAG TPA: hypothetical protein PL152_04600 [Steroidobacteraceae bacterium]|nr:hypothetical protein [Steroidobacteraceae bacterium]HQR48592.1 hypothetical protein [Steroidobacteraceae bacterium]